MTNMSFKDFLKKTVLEEQKIPSVWNKKPINSIPEDEEEDIDDTEDDLDDEEVVVDQDMEDDDTDGMGSPMVGDGMDDEGEPEDPDKAGVIRNVEGAHLVYKRQDEEGTYEELWMYNIGEELKDELNVRRSILAGTDIPQGKTKSEDNAQTFELWSSGDVQFLHITGLPN